jgi:hypothetical protein
MLNHEFASGIEKASGLQKELHKPDLAVPVRKPVHRKSNNLLKAYLSKKNFIFHIQEFFINKIK